MQGYTARQYPQQPYYGQYPSPAMPYMQLPAGSTINTPPAETPTQGELPLEQSYIENILRLNRGKIATIYMTFENNEEWNAKVFRGVVEAAGRDHVILRDPESNTRYILLMIYVDYITFDEELEYDYPYGASPVR